MHNLIHLADDVVNLNTPLSNISAFWGESYIGVFKKLVKSPNKPLTQIINRLSELECSDRFKIKKHHTFSNCIINDCAGLFHYGGSDYKVISSIKINNTTLKEVHPDNVVLLKNSKIFRIERILKKHDINEQCITTEKIFMLGREMKNQ